jgi:probable F420-dependent oxidoreductase
MNSLPEPPNFYEPLVTFAYLAGQVTRIRLVAATIVAPLREPVVLAKQVATLDQASQGRFVLGLGIGSYREEFEAIARLSGRVNRGRMMEETIEALRQIFDQRRASFDGQYVRFSEIEVYPKPVQQPFPIYLSGSSPAGIARAARIANGWIVAGVSPDRAKETIGTLREEIANAGRDEQEVETCAQVWVCIGETESDARSALRRSQHFQRLAALSPTTDLVELEANFAARNLLGTPDQVAEQVERYRSAGVDHLALVFLAASVDELIDQVGIFARTVLSSTRGETT